MWNLFWGLYGLFLIPFVIGSMPPTWVNNNSWFYWVYLFCIGAGTGYILVESIGRLTGAF